LFPISLDGELNPEALALETNELPYQPNLSNMNVSNSQIGSFPGSFRSKGRESMVLINTSA